MRQPNWVLKGTQPWSEKNQYTIDLYPLNIGKGVRNAAEALFSFKLALKAKILVIHVAEKTSVWPELGWQQESVTRIWPREYVSDQNLALSRRQYDQNWRLFTAKFWSLTSTPIQIPVTDVSSQPNFGHWRLLLSKLWSHWHLLGDMYYKNLSFKS